MNELFIRILNVGITGGWIALGVILLRPLLKRTPRWVHCLLWSLVALRLLLPVELYSYISLQPSGQVIPTNITTAAEPAINSGIAVINDAINPVLTEIAQPQHNGLEQLLSVAAKAWLIGVGLLLLYTVIAYLRLIYQVRIKVRIQKRVYICDDISSPFILGALLPRIYLPSALGEQQRTDVLAHEQAHLKRRDHWWKPLGFLLLAVYWFNPLLWVAYILLCRDIEQACDEKVIANMTPREKSHYAQTLLQCSVRRHMVAACPVAFGEVSVKHRVKGILSYKNPGFWVVLLSLVVCTVVAACFLTDPLPCKHDYSEVVLSAPGCTESGRTKMLCKKCDHSYVRRTTETGHHYEDGTVLTQPTCTSTGLRNRVCKDCGHSYNVEINKVAHQYKDGDVTVQPTCTTTGVRNRICAVCNHTVTAPVEMTEHIPGLYTVTQLPTCSKEGTATTNCTACGISMTTSVARDPQAHELQETVVTASTCDADGEGVIACRLCGYAEKCTYEKLEHEFLLFDSQPATCSTDGFVMYKCRHCNATYTISRPHTNSHKLNFSGLCIVCGRWFNNSYSKKDGNSSTSFTNTNFPVVIWDRSAYNKFYP